MKYSLLNEIQFTVKTRPHVPPFIAPLDQQLNPERLYEYSHVVSYKFASPVPTRKLSARAFSSHMFYNLQ